MSEFNGFIGLHCTGQTLRKAMWENNKDTNEAQTNRNRIKSVYYPAFLKELHSLGLAEPFDQSLGCEGSQAAGASSARQQWMPSTQS